MQTTLLGLAVALILALLAALVGPLFIDWDQYRASFETQATRLVGAPVRIDGKIDARLLPTPSLALQGLEIGAADTPNKVRVDRLEIEFALGPLLRGQWHAAQLRIDGPQFALGLDRSGRVIGSAPAIAFDPDQLSIERLAISNGRVNLTDAASGSRLTLENLRFNGDVRSLIGPFKGEGGFVSSGQVYGYQISAGRRGEDGGTKLRFSLDPADRPLTAEAEGVLWLDGGQPRFEGGLTLARPVGLALASGKTVLNDPWRVTSRVKASASAALLEQVEFQYGPEDRALKLAGTAEVKFGRRPQLDGVLTARQLDLDRAFGPPDARRRPPLAVLNAFAHSIGEAIRPPMPVRLGIGVDALTLGGAALQTVRGDFKSLDGAWSVDSFEFRAPGLTQVKASGRLEIGAANATFSGPAEIDASDPKALIAWIEGRTETAQGPVGGLHARGNVTFAPDRIAVDRLQAEFDRKSFAGRLDYTFAAADRPAKLDAALNAAVFDFDGAAAFVTAAFANTNFDRPEEIALALDIGRATLAGVDAKNAKAKLRLDASGLQIERLSVADLGGAALEASGRIDTSSPSARGALSLDLDAQSLDGLTALAARFVPQVADVLRGAAGRLAPAKISAKLSVQGAESAGDARPTDRTAAKFRLGGRLGALRIAIDADANGEIGAPAAADLKLNGQLDADDGSALAALFAVDQLAAVDKRPGKFTLAASGPLGGDLAIDARFSSGGFDAAASGKLRPSDAGANGTLDLSLKARDVPRLHRDPLRTVPVDLKSKLTLAGRSLKLDDVAANVAGSDVRGRLALEVGQPLRVDGRLNVDAVDVAMVIGSLVGTPPQPVNSARTSSWSVEPFGEHPIGDVDGHLAFELGNAALTPRLVAKDLRGTMRFGRASLSFEDLDGILAEGRLLGKASFTRDSSGVSARARLALSHANAAVLLPGPDPSPLSGRMTVNVDVAGTGLSPAALVGSLSGTGSVSLEKAQITGFDPQVFDAVARAVERGLPSDAIRVGDFASKALDAGHLDVARADAALTISNGQVRLGNVLVHGNAADLAVSGMADLSEQTLDMRFGFSGVAGKDGVLNGRRPELAVSLKGPVAKPQRAVDVSALVGWLTLRSVEQEAKRLEAIEAAAHAAQHDGPVGSTPPSAKPSPARPTPSLERAPDLPPPIDVKPIPGFSGRRAAHPSSSAADNRQRPLMLLPSLP